jgi:hypothetical protein
MWGVGGGSGERLARLARRDVVFLNFLARFMRDFRAQIGAVTHLKILFGFLRLCPLQGLGRGLPVIHRG